MQQPPGWYPNPADATQLRWWDGNAWTDHTAPIPAWQPGWDIAPQQPKRRIWPWVVFPILAVMVVVGVAAAIFVPRVIGVFKHPIDAANVYYGDLRDSQLTDAYAHVCTSLRDEMTYDQYAQRVRDEETDSGHVIKFNAHQVHRVIGHGDQAIVDVDLTTTDRTEAIEVVMMNENGHWLFCGRRSP
jgi:hypothetical protein